MDILTSPIPNSISDIQMPVYTPILIKCQNYEIKRAKYFYEMEKIILIIAQRHLHNGIHYKDLGQNQNYHLTINCKTKKTQISQYLSPDPQVGSILFNLPFDYV